MLLRLSLLAISSTLILASAKAQTLETGRRQYEARCIGCHGADGDGGGHGPAILRANSLEAIRAVILKGIAAKGMPAFSIREDEASAIAMYVMKLKHPVDAAATASAPAPGNREAGERFFTGRGNCTACHMVRGRGGILGPDLSAIGRDRRPSQIEQKLLDPGIALPGAPSYHAVTVTLRDGKTIRGIAKNESAFDMQLL